MDRKQERNKERAKKGLAKYLTSNPVAQTIAKNTAVVNKFREIYNVLCPSCQARVCRSGGKLPASEYCPDCQEKVLPLMKDVKRMLGKHKQGED